MNKSEFDKLMKSIRRNGGKWTTKFQDGVITGIELYWGETNRNIAVINTLIETAYVLKGVPVNKLIQYLKEVIPHKTQKDPNTGKTLFGKQDEEKVAFCREHWQEFVTQWPVWYEYSRKSEPAEFNANTYADTVAKRLDKQITENKIGKDELEYFRNTLNRFIDERVTELSQNEGEAPQLPAGGRITHYHKGDNNDDRDKIPF